MKSGIWSAALTLLVLCFANAVEANNYCTGLEVISRTIATSNGICDELSQFVHLNASSCKPPTNGACDEGQFFNATAPLDPITNVPTQCCSLETSNSSYVVDDELYYFTSSSNTPSCADLVADGYMSALRAVVPNVSSIDSNGTLSSLTVFECQGIKVKGRADLSFGCSKDTFMAGFTFSSLNSCLGNPGLVLVPLDQCVLMTFDNWQFQCPNNTWLKDDVTVEYNEPRPLCCKATVKDFPEVFATTTEIINATDLNNGWTCPNDTFQVGFTKPHFTPVYLCAGFNYTLPVETTSTSVYYQHSNSYGYGNYFNRVADPLRNIASTNNIHSFVVTLLGSLLMMM